ncbi:hypothetical protein SO180_42465, partial [Bradyrhizobium sp. UFLA05-112]
YTPKYEKAADCLSKDRYALLAFYDFRPSIGSTCGPRMRWTSDFFMTEMTIAESRTSILLFGCAAGHSSVPATDLAAAARRGGQGWLVCGHRKAWP